MTEGNSTKRDICTFDYSIRVVNNHAGSTLTLPVRGTNMASPYKSSINLGKTLF